MCGISGIIDTQGRPVSREEIERITDRIAHRGPDGFGYYVGPSFALGHRRLSIIDLSEHGRQPMCYRGRYWLIHNGEVYNYIEVRAELEKLGHTFTSCTDTEVILAAYAQWGPACCARFNGMWAFVIYDTEAQRLFISRDRFGVKPLYWLRTPGRIAFASEIKALLPLQPQVRANRDAVLQSMLTSIDGNDEATFFDGVTAFPQGHHATYDVRAAKLTVERYYSLRPDPSFASLSRTDAAAAFRELFDNAVRIRLRADVPVGTCVSGGLDSSAISASASRMYHAEADRAFIGIHAKSMDAETDESRHARRVAEHLGLDLHVVEPSIEDFLSTVDELAYTQEEPFGSASMFMGWHVFKKAKELGCTVMLNGQGGDEVLLGYQRYLSSYLRSVPLRRFPAEVRAQARHTRSSVARILANGAYFQSAGLRIGRLKRRSLLRPEFKQSRAFDVVRASVRSFRRVEDLQILEISSIQLPHLLRYEDRNSMRHSIETRLPFLDYRVVEACVGMPPEHKVHDGWSKHVLRVATSDLLPPEILWRRDKLGFEAPMRSWVGAARPRMKAAVAASPMLREITEHRRLLDGYDGLALGEQWRYFNLAAWERRFAVQW